jgi:hypothetical protein
MMIPVRFRLGKSGKMMALEVEKYLPYLDGCDMTHNRPLRKGARQESDTLPRSRPRTQSYPSPVGAFG